MIACRLVLLALCGTPRVFSIARPQCPVLSPVMCNPELFICKSLFQCTIPGKRRTDTLAIRVMLTVFVKTGGASVVLCACVILRGKAGYYESPKLRKNVTSVILTPVISGG